MPSSNAPIWLTLAAAAGTLVIVGGVLGGPALLRCAGASEGLLACLRGEIVDIGLLPEPEAGDEPMAAPQTPEPPPAVIAADKTDLTMVRAEPDGQVLIAGTAAAGLAVQVFVNGELLGETTAEPSGDWVLVPDEPLPAGKATITVGPAESDPPSATVVIAPDKVSPPVVTIGSEASSMPTVGATPKPPDPAPAPAAAVPEAPASPSLPAPAPDIDVATTVSPEPPAAPTVPLPVTAPAPTSATPAVTKPPPQEATPEAVQPEKPKPESPKPQGAQPETPKPVAKPEPAEPEKPTTQKESQPAAPKAPTPTSDVPTSSKAPAVAVPSADPEDKAKPTKDKPAPRPTTPSVTAEPAPAAGPARPVTPVAPIKPVTPVKPIAPIAPATAEAPTSSPPKHVADTPKATPLPKVAEPATPLLPAAAPTIDAIEVDGTANYFAGAGPEGATVELFVQDRFIASARVEGGRWLVEAQGSLTLPAQRVRVQLTDAEDNDRSARGEVNFLLDLTPFELAGSGSSAAGIAAEAAGDLAFAVQPESELEVDPAIPTLRATPSADPQMLRFSSGKAIIRRGETLWSIARRVYGDGAQYTKIVGANSELIAHPERIFPGQVFDLPALGVVAAEN